MNYVFYLRSEISSQHLNSSQDTSPYLFIFKFEVKFTNFIHLDPYLENANLKSATLCVSKAMSPRLTCSGVGDGLGEEGATLRK